jgi:acetolactate synthase small subunit
MIPFKKYFLKKQFQKKLVENEIHRIVCQKEIKTVGIITTDEISKWIEIKEEVEKILNVENVKIYSFKSHKNKNPLKDFSEKEFNWKGNIFEENFKSFIDEPFDLLIGYFNKNNLYLESAVLQSKALFKVGISDVNQQLYDMEIAETPSKQESFFLELKKYLTILRKLKN